MVLSLLAASAIMTLTICNSFQLTFSQGYIPPPPSLSSPSQNSIKSQFTQQTPSSSFENQPQQQQQQQNSLINPNSEVLLSTDKKVIIDKQLSPTNNKIVTNPILSSDTNLKDPNLINRPIKHIGKNNPYNNINIDGIHAYISIITVPYNFTQEQTNSISFSMCVYTHDLKDPSLKYYPATPKCTSKVNDKVLYTVKPGTVVLSIIHSWNKR